MFTKREKLEQFRWRVPDNWETMEKNRGDVGKAFSFPGMYSCLRDRPDLDWFRLLSIYFPMARVRPLPSLAPNRRHAPGERLRALRVVHGLTLRDVHQASIGLSKKLRNSQFLLPPSRLHEFETRNVIPSIHRLYTLACIYGREMAELFDWYGIPRRRLRHRPSLS